MHSPYTVPVLHNTIRIMTPFLFAAIGGLFTELAGMLNIALEGLMLIGAFFSVIFTAFTGNLFLGLTLGILSSVLVALIFGWISLYLKANIFITGLTTNLLAPGLTTVLAFQIFGNKGVIRFENIPNLTHITIPIIRRIPLLNDILSGHNFLVYLSWLTVIIAAIVIYETPFGLRLRATGLNPRAIESYGLKPRRIQLAAILISGFTCGLGGSMLSLEMGAFVPNLTAGRGWIALVAIYLGSKRPLGIVIASFVFALTDSISNYVQGITSVPADFILATPYMVTLLAMIGWSVWQYYRAKE